MAIYSLGDLSPNIHADAFVHPEATLIGDVTIGAYSSIWPGAVLRGDLAAIRVGERTSIQDGAIIHTGQDKPTYIGSNVIIGHLVHLEGCTIGDRCLIGVGSVVRHNSVIEDEALVGAHAVVLDGTRVPTGNRALGLPAKVAQGLVDLKEIDRIVELYVENSQRYKTSMQRIV